MTYLCVTFGPAMASTDTVDRILTQGVRGVRMPSSRHDPSTLARMAELVLGVADRIGAEVELILDLPGHAARLTNDEVIELGAAEQLVLSFGPASESRAASEFTFGISGADSLPHIESGDVLLIGDGREALGVVGLGQGHMITTPLTNGVIWPRQRISVSDRHSSPRAAHGMPDRLRRLVSEIPFHGLFVSFARSGADVELTRAAVSSDTDRTPVVAAKVETREGVERIAEIVDATEVVLLGRGDLLVDVGAQEFHAAERTVIDAVLKAPDTRLIIGTQLLTSMDESWMPHRSEIAYLSGMLERGVDGFLLSDETTVGARPAEAVELLAALAARYGTSDLHSLSDSRRPAHG